MKTKLLTLAALLITIVSFSQKKSRGDRFYENGDYRNAIEQYADQLNKGEYSKHVLTNIATSYYNTFQFRRAYRALLRVTAGKFQDKDKTYDNEFNFKMYQVLSALGEYDKALPYLELYKTNNKEDSIDRNVAIATIEAFKLKDDDFVVKPKKSLNTSDSEFGAVKSGDFVYFTSDRKSNGFFDKNYRWTHRPFLNLYKVKVDSSNVIKSEISPLGSNVNSSLHEGSLCFTKDGNTMYLSRSNTDRGRKKFDSIRHNAIHLYRSIKTDTVWSAPEKLIFNNINYTIEHPALNEAEDKLYFASNMPGGYGDFDLYYVDVNEDGTYGDPVNLGNTINTEHREQFPFVSVDGNLFFSSNGHLGLGMMDVFVAELDNGGFSSPVNLGAPINSSFDDFSLNYYNKEDGFFASNRNKKSDEIYAFSQIGEVFLRPYNARFEVREFATKNYIPNASVSLIDSEDNVVYENKLDSISAFNLDVMPARYNFKASSPFHDQQLKPLLVKEKDNETYIIYLQKNEQKIQENKDEYANSSVVVKKEPSKEELKKQLLEDTEGPKVVERNGKMFFDLPPIYFDYDKWNIRADSKKVLDDFALKLEKYKTVYIKISSHTDSRGSDTYNQLLSEKRAESTRNYLALVGYVNARRMTFAGFGESVPLIGCADKVCTEQEHQINRRSEFEIVKF